jgi:hypothetical protein
MTQPSAGSQDPPKPDRFELERLKKLEAIEALGSLAPANGGFTLRA